MKDVKPGKWNNPFKIKVECIEPQCGATFIAEEKDVLAVGYSSKNDFYVLCPICGQHIDVPMDRIPLRVQRILNKKRPYRSGD